MNPSKLNKRITIQQEITNKKMKKGIQFRPNGKMLSLFGQEQKHHLERDLIMKYSLEIPRMRYVQ